MAGPQAVQAAGAFERAAASPAMAAALIESLGLIDVRDLMSGLAVPALVLHREADLIPVADARELAGQIPGASLKVLPGRDHLPWLGDGQAVIEEILGFVDQVAPTLPRTPRPHPAGIRRLRPREEAAVTELLTVPPPPEAMAAMAAIPRSQITPVVLGIQQGPEGHLGPEKAGAILMLQATFTDPEGSATFWKGLVRLFELLESAPGFIRRYGFADGPHNTLIAFWRTAQDAKAFAARPEHLAAVRDLYQQRWQYSHFAAIWEMTTNHDRVIFCPRCQAVTPAAHQRCGNCDTELSDVYLAYDPVASDQT